jgi:hypothetical protein
LYNRSRSHVHGLPIPKGDPKGYEITAVVEELIESAERRVPSKLTGKALRVYLDRE